MRTQKSIDFSIPLLRRILSFSPIWGGLLFCAIFYWTYQGIPDTSYQFRDDAIITLSHSRNWVDYGIIGINPSGGWVEGFSAPLSFLLYAPIWLISKMHYAQYLSAQLWICTFMLGYLCTCIVRQSIVLTALAALLLTQCGAFVMWHGSGMENSLLHVAIAGILLSLYHPTPHKDRAIFALPFSIALLIRLDAPFYILPLLIWHLVQNHNNSTAQRKLIFLGYCLLPVLLLHIGRGLIFGDLLPNTAYAQNISVIERLDSLFSGESQTWHYSLYLGIELLLQHGVLYGLFLLPWLKCLWSKPQSRTPLITLLLVGSTVFCAPFIFGEARLDPARITTFAATAIVFSVLRCAALISDPWKRLAFLSPLMIILLYPSLFESSVQKILPLFAKQHQKGLSFYAKQEICCSNRPPEQLHQELTALAATHQLYRPLVALPDLGVLSWHKSINIIDLGRLGSPALAKAQGPAEIADHIFEELMPDIIQSHGHWSCQYSESIFEDPRFLDHFVPLRISPSPCPTGTNGLWMRKEIMRDSTSPERKLIDDLQKDPSWHRIEAERDRCITDCSYIDRSIYRFHPELSQLKTQAPIR